MELVAVFELLVLLKCQSCWLVVLDTDLLTTAHQLVMRSFNVHTVQPLRSSQGSSCIYYNWQRLVVSWFRLMIGEGQLDLTLWSNDTASNVRKDAHYRIAVSPNPTSSASSLDCRLQVDFDVSPIQSSGWSFIQNDLR